MQDLLHRVLEFTGEGVYRYRYDDGVVLLANPALARILDLDLDPKEITGKNIQDLMGPEAAALHGDLASIGEIRGREYEFTTCKGNRRRVVHDVFVVEDAAMRTRVVEGMLRDVTDAQCAKDALSRQSGLLQVLMDAMPDLIFFKDEKSRFIAGNKALARLMLGHEDVSQLLGKTDFDFHPPELAARYFADENHVMLTGEPITAIEEPVLDSVGNPRWFSTTKAPIRDEQGRVVGIVGIGRDITEHRRVEDALRLDEQRLEALYRLGQMAGASLQELSSFALEEAIRLAGSTVGYLAFLNEDESVLTMYAWSREAMEECLISDKPLIYPVEQTGLWGEAVRQRKPIITNDYAAPNPWKKGLPEGHVHLNRHMNVPVFEGNRIVLVAGVGNKATDYDESDVRQLSLLMDGMWRLVRQRQSDEALFQSEWKYRTLFDVFPTAIFLEELDGRVLDCNTAACEMYGWSREEMLRLSVADLVPADLAQRLPAFEDENLLKGGFFIEAQGKRKNGEIFPTEVNSRTIKLGEQMLVLVSVRDITEIKRIREERERLNLQIQQTQKLESLGVLAGGIAHDFNNLLTGILGHASLALMTLSPVSPARANIQQVEIAARRAADLTRQLLAYSGKGRFVVERIHLSELVEEMMHLLEVSVSKKCSLRCHFAADTPCIEADATQIRQIVMNLIINASEAIGDRQGTITIATGCIECDRAYLAETYLDEALPEGRYAFLEVSDTGCGMTPEIRARLFDPFFTTKFAGRGLGLAALLGIVRGHRGAVKVYSEPGKGSSFKVLFPAAEAPEECWAAPIVSNRAWKGEGLILVVDDEAIVRDLAADALGGKGFEVITACDGVEGVALFRNREKDLRAVVLDLTMPNMDGLEAFSEMRRINASVPVILSSGYNEQDATERFAGKGLAGFLHKPYRVEDLLDAVARVVSV
ncbi:MAG TPA: PAS domain S-box protein [Candidatus Hydrogenedentes bacterium]|mgnify:FL=1|nr:PAS domain S-box protein [Candidatus Hydrogenedentota bacterium]HRT18932.1 PAS domain S-box protein [Candidatus Hydrogenedentota bacterium]HRT64956.1 PAS domain S-box protein [Candidatus Hydrogenedentota bacterium]